MLSIVSVHIMLLCTFCNYAPPLTDRRLRHPVSEYTVCHRLLQLLRVSSVVQCTCCHVTLPSPLFKDHRPISIGMWAPTGCYVIRHLAKMTDHSAEMHDCIDEVETVVFELLRRKFSAYFCWAANCCDSFRLVTPSIATTISASTHHSDLTYKHIPSLTLQRHLSFS